VRADRLHLNTRRRYSLCQIHPHTCTYMYIYVYIHIHTYMYMCIHVYTCTCIYLYIHICIYICTYIYVYIYMYICVHVVYIHISIRTEQSELISCTSMKTGTLSRSLLWPSLPTSLTLSRKTSRYVYVHVYKCLCEYLHCTFIYICIHV